jgi:hypothetical protein
MAVTQTRDEIIAMLQAGDVTIDYTKLDGTNRVLDCTLQESVIPVVQSDKDPNAERKVNLSNIVVWDNVAGAWRTVILDRINSITA